MKARNNVKGEGEGEKSDAEKEEAEPATDNAGGGFMSMGLAGLANAAGIGGGQGDKKAFSSAGFPGITQGFMGARTSGGGAGFSLAAFGGGLMGRGSTTQKKKTAQSQAVTEPNAVIVIGYAESIEKIEEFKANLEKEARFVESGVYFHESRIHRVGMSALDAPDLSIGGSIGAGVGAASGGSASRGRANRGRANRDSGSFNLGNLANLGAFAQPTYNARTSYYNEPEIFSFRFDLQFLGAQLPKPQ